MPPNYHPPTYPIIKTVSKSYLFFLFKRWLLIQTDTATEETNSVTEINQLGLLFRKQTIRSTRIM